MVTLTDEDRAILEALADGNRPADRLADELDRDRERVEEQLGVLEENGLVHGEGDGWALTRNGHHLLRSPGDGSEDDRVETTDEVEAELEAAQLRPDREDAVRAAFTFLQFWGEATREEIVDAAYDEHPAGHDDPDDWWTDLVEEYLAALPGVERPDGPERPWRYSPAEEVYVQGDGASGDDDGDGGTDAGDGATDRAEPPGDADDLADASSQVDGRETGVDDPDDARGSLKHALETLEVDEDERRAVLAAVTLLRDRGTASADEIAAAVHDRYDAGRDAPEALWEGTIRPALESLPEVERAGDERWRYAAPGGADGENEEKEEATPDAADREEADACPICGESYEGRSVHLTSGTMVPARDARTCVRATPTDAGVAVTLYYHRRGEG